MITKEQILQYIVRSTAFSSACNALRHNDRARKWSEEDIAETLFHITNGIPRYLEKAIKYIMLNIDNPDLFEPSDELNIFDFIAREVSFDKEDFRYKVATSRESFFEFRCDLQ
jgi:hypothetical protein